MNSCKTFYKLNNAGRGFFTFNINSMNKYQNLAIHMVSGSSQLIADLWLSQGSSQSMLAGYYPPKTNKFDYDITGKSKISIAFRKGTMYLYDDLSPLSPVFTSSSDIDLSNVTEVYFEHQGNACIVESDKLLRFNKLVTKATDTTGNGNLTFIIGLIILSAGCFAGVMAWHIHSWDKLHPEDRIIKRSHPSQSTAAKSTHAI